MCRLGTHETVVKHSALIRCRETGSLSSMTVEPASRLRWGQPTSYGFVVAVLASKLPPTTSPYNLKSDSR
jgi:hypothetical protein